MEAATGLAHMSVEPVKVYRIWPLVPLFVHGIERSLWKGKRGLNQGEQITFQYLLMLAFLLF